MHRDLCTLCQYHEAMLLLLFPIFFKAKVITNELTIKMCLSGEYRVTVSFLAVGAMFTQQQGENTVMENVDKLGDSVLCPIRMARRFHIYSLN